MTYLLVARRNGELLVTADLTRRRKLTLGRSGRCDLHLDAVSVSRRHAILVRHGRSWVVIDTASTTGVHIEAGDGAEERVPFAELAQHRWVRIGPAFLWLEGPVEPADSPPAAGAVASAAPPCLRVHELSGRPARVLALAGLEAVTVGRGDECDVGIADAELSRLHAVLYLEGRRWCVVDAGSSTGTRVDGVPCRRKRLEDHSLLRLGSHLLRVDGARLGSGEPLEMMSAIFDGRLDAQAAAGHAPPLDPAVRPIR